MKASIINFVPATALAGLLTGCVAPNGEPDYTGSGALIGGASGAGIGALAPTAATRAPATACNSKTTWAPQTGRT